MSERKVAVLAIGGNSLVKDKNHITVPDQFNVTRETCSHIADMVQNGYDVVITHGNGPQVGYILRRSELSEHELHPVPLDSCGADTQGSIGYMIQQSLANELVKRGVVGKEVVTVVTQVLVDRKDKAFQSPSKPIGSFMSEEDALAKKQNQGWDVVEDAGRGWRRVVASPLPEDIVEKESIKTLIKNGYIVVAVGGGGIPVIKENGDLKGVAAVIDKDYASSLLATILGADVFIISTAVEQVALNYGKANQVLLDRMTVAEAKGYLDQGHFPSGSMGPKIRAVLSFLERGGKEAIVTSPEAITRALAGKAGTRIVP